MTPNIYYLAPWLIVASLGSSLSQQKPATPSPALERRSIQVVELLQRPVVESFERSGEPRTLETLGFKDDGTKHSLGREVDMDPLRVKSKITIVDRPSDAFLPQRRSGWQAEESVRVPLLGFLSLVGQLGANSTSVEWQHYEFIGRTGVALKLPKWLGGEIQIQGGRSITNFDSDSESLIPERSTVFVEFITLWPLSKRLNLEYSGKAIPAATANDRDFIRQELKLAVPLSQTAKFHVGARYWREDVVNATPWIERARMIVGLELQR